MYMKLLPIISSFRFRIIVTLIIVITSFSMASFYYYNSYLTNMLYKNAEDDLRTILEFLQKQVITARDGRIIKPLLKTESKTNHCIMQTYVLDGNGNMVFCSNNYQYAIHRNSLLEMIKKPEEISINSIQTDSTPFSRASIRFNNAPQCYGCHSPSVKMIGFIIVDYSMYKSHNTIASTRKFSIFFTIVLIALILGLVMVLHYRFVKGSLSKFRGIINSINKGDLEKRVNIPRSRELGELGSSFNQMIEHFQQTQNELMKYHDKEIRNTQRLATIGEMSARLAHEIRNPMTGIANAIEIIIEETNNNQNKAVLEEIRRQANRVNKAVSNLLKFSQTKELNLRKESINEIIKSVVFFLENQSGQKKIQFIMDLDPEIPDFLFDPDQIENVLLNLGINAVQAFEKSGVVLYMTQFDALKKRAHISVSDSGPGIPDEIMNEIFTPFYTTRTEGTGLGLAIVKEIIDLHNGTIIVKNNPDKGCTFQILLHTNGNIFRSPLNSNHE